MSQKVFEAIYDLIKELEHSGSVTQNITGHWNTYPACPICKAGEDDDHEEGCQLETTLLALEEFQVPQTPSKRIVKDGEVDKDKTIYD